MFKLFGNKNKSSISINGQTFVGNNVSISNGKIIVDGKEIDPDGFDGKEINVTINGDINCDKINATQLTVNGNITGEVDCTSLQCVDINGDVDCTSLQCDAVYGNVDATSVSTRR